MSGTDATGTLPVHGSPEWLDERREYLGASEVAGALALSPYEKPLDVWARKLAIVEPRAPSFAMEAGTALEPVILRRYAARTGALVELPRTMIHAGHSWLRAHLDAIADGKRNVQVKWVPHGRDKWGAEEEGADGVPEWYLVQVQIEMEIAHLDETDVAAQFPGEEIPRIYRVPRDPDLAAALVEESRAWWETYIVPHDPDRFPDGAGSRDVLAARFPKIVRALQPATAEIEALARQYDADGNALSVTHARTDHLKSRCHARRREAPMPARADTPWAVSNGMGAVTLTHNGRTAIYVADFGQDLLCYEDDLSSEKQLGSQHDGVRSSGSLCDHATGRALYRSPV